MTSQPKGLKLGTTLYSMTTQFHAREYTFEELVRKVAAEGLGPGLEVVGFQSIRGFPEVTDEFADRFKALIEETGLQPSCLGINADLRLDPDKPMTDDESVVYHTRQLQAAAKLGFPVARYQYPAGPEVIRRLAPVAEKLGVKLGLEIHAPHHVQHPDVLAYREMYEQVKSPYLGFIPDFGSTSRNVPPSLIDYYLNDAGIPDWMVKLGLEIWHEEGDAYQRRERFFTRAREKGAEARHLGEMAIMFGLFSRAEPRSWLEIMPQVVHIHGKFFDFDDDGNEVAVDYTNLLPVFVEGGYDGFMSSEYEGHMWCDADGFDKIRRHHKLCKQILAKIQG